MGCGKSKPITKDDDSKDQANSSNSTAVVEKKSLITRVGSTNGEEGARVTLQAEPSSRKSEAPPRSEDLKTRTTSRKKLAGRRLAITTDFNDDEDQQEDFVFKYERLARFHRNTPNRFHALRCSSLNDVDEHLTAARLSELQVIEKSEEDQQRILHALSENFLFKALEKKLQLEIMNAMESLPVEAGSTVITQGERGDFFYIIDTGTYNVHLGKNDSTAVATLEYPSLFGTPLQSGIATHALAFSASMVYIFRQSVSYPRCPTLLPYGVG
eukprot:923627-Prorocentrum_minimum.AAC.1